MSTAWSTEPPVRPMAPAILRDCASVRPVSGSISSVMIFSGVLWATSSMSMPPSLDAMKATFCVPRSVTSETYSSFLMSAPSSM